MRARRTRSVDKITSSDAYFSGDDGEPSNEIQPKNSLLTNSPRRRSPKQFNKRRLVTKQSQTSETLKWLSENYELIQGVCVPRCVLYTHYLDFCKRRKFSSAGPASYGKLIRQRFPKLTTRRLGTRGQSKYHYYGISIKQTSPYYHSFYSGKGLTRFSGAQTPKEGISEKFCFDKKGGNRLPDFPKASEMFLEGNLSVEKVDTFIIMYRTHCQRLLDTIMNANFDEVHKFLLHFWQGMPGHMIPVLQCSAVVNIIAVCDSLLYKILNDVLVPSCIQDIPESLTDVIKTFAATFVKSLEFCLTNTPNALKSQKIKVAKNFVRLLKRNMTFINLAQIARPIFLSYESMSGILTEFRRLDLKRILTELLFLMEKNDIELSALLLFIQEFENLLIKQAPIEAYAEWLDSIVDEFVLKIKSYDDSRDLAERSEVFLTNWSFVTSRVLEELTLRSASTFGSFQLIIMMFEEYIFLIIENQMIAKLDTELKSLLTRHLKKSDLSESKGLTDVCENYASWNHIEQQQQQQQQQQQPQLEQQQKQQHQRRHHPQQQQQQQQQHNHEQQQQQLLLLEQIQQQMQQFENPDVQYQTVTYDTQPQQNSSEFQYAAALHRQNETEQVDERYRNTIPVQNQSQYTPEMTSIPSLYYQSEDIHTNSVQMYNPAPAGSVSGGEDVQTTDTLTQNESLSNLEETSTDPDYGFVTPGETSYVARRRSYGGGNDQCQTQGYHQGYPQGQGHNQVFDSQVQGHHQDQGQQDQGQQDQGHHQDQGQHQGHHQDQGHHQGQQDQGHHQGQQDLSHQQDHVRSHYQGQVQDNHQGQGHSDHLDHLDQFQGNPDADDTHYGNISNSYLGKDDTPQGASKTVSDINFISSVSENKRLNRKNTLPSFHHLSSQLVRNSQLFERY